MKMDRIFNRCLVLTLLSVLLMQNVQAYDWEERRRDQFGKDFSYFVYPIAGDIPGLGSAAGLGATILNINDTDLDFTGFNIKGDFDASGYTFLDYHILKNRLVLDFGFYDYLVAPLAYKRGIDSSPDDYILPKAEGEYVQGQLTLSFMQRKFETYLRYGSGKQRLLQVLNKDGDEFTAVDNKERSGYRYSLGAIVDDTDDRLDPRKGYRLEAAINSSSNDDDFLSDFYVTDYNMTAYFPFRRYDTLAFNFFRSDAHITNRVDADADALRAANRGLGCDPVDNECLQAETERFNQIIAANQYGTATPLGGTQRLRSFANQRFYAGHSAFYGAEYRMNLTDKRTPFDVYIAKGIRTGLQLAFFAEQGSVAEHASDLFDTRKTSYGVGFRLVLSGVIIRADYANGSEGSEFVLFINYPWSMFSVDS